MIFGTVQEHFVANPSLNFIFTGFAAKMCYFNVCSVYAPFCCVIHSDNVAVSDGLTLTEATRA